MTAAGRSGPGLPSLETVAAMVPAPLAAAPEQALKAEVSETASEPDRLFAPDFIISQVYPFGMAPTGRLTEVVHVPNASIHLV